MQGDITNFFNNLVNIGIAVGALVCAFFLIFAGYRWMSAGGNVRQLETAKQALFNALAGLAIVLAAKIIANLVVTVIGTAPPLT